jgi:hypothetical protein
VVVRSENALPPRHPRVPTPLLTPRPNTADSDEPLPSKRHYYITGAIKLLGGPSFYVYYRYRLNQVEIGLIFTADEFESTFTSLFISKKSKYN